MYKIGDIVLVKSCAGDAIPDVHVRLTKKIEVKGKKGRNMDWPPYVGWECILIYPEEAEQLRKEWGIPFRYPDEMETFTRENNIIKKISINKALKGQPRRTKSKSRTN